MGGGYLTMTRHKVFISYHHENDQEYKNRFVRLFDNHYDVFIDGSVGDGDISDGIQTETIRQTIRDTYLRNTSVTLVLIGKETWKRKHVDWEISSSLRDTAFNPRSGLLGILLPTHPDFNKGRYSEKIIPPRLADNCKNKYASIYNWSEDPKAIMSWIDKAFEDKGIIIPDNSREMFGKNRTGESWSD
jgi:hypothetical protein